MKGKKGDTQLYSFITYIVFVLIVFLVLLSFVNRTATGTVTKQQVLAKEIALLVDSSPTGTELIIEKGNFTIIFKENKVEVNSKDIASYPYEYEFSTMREIETSEQDTKIIIKILR
ncbi:hypothetical protein J4433_02910 [Candidatus Pacearchaeota archaeon]|nr:hypothetical protein [Candidatus Pacearchaeota archaeon]